MVFLKHYGASNILTAFMRGTLPGILGMVLGPILSYKSDRHRGRWGRRRPFLFVGVPMAALAIMGMAISPILGRWLHPTLERWAQGWTGKPWEPNYSVLLCFGMFFAIFDVAAVLTGSVFAAFFNDVVPREVLGRFWGLVRAVSIGVMIVFMGGIIGVADHYYALIFLAVGLIYGVGFMSTVFMVKEGEYPPPEGQREAGRSGRAMFINIYRAVASYFRVCFGKPFYLWVFAAQILPNSLAFASIYTWSQWFATKNVGLNVGQYGRLTALYFIISLPLTPLQGWLADKFHPLRVAMVVLALHIPAALWGGLYIHDGTTFAIAFVITGLLQVLWGTATTALWPLLYPKATFAQLTSAADLLATIIGMGYGLSLGWFLDYTHSNYRYTFLLAGILDVVALAATVVVYQKFKALGGTKGYVAP
ncbi:MAG: MFS transporter [Phycisphaerae bacterium]